MANHQRLRVQPSMLSLVGSLLNAHWSVALCLLQLKIECREIINIKYSQCNDLQNQQSCSYYNFPQTLDFCVTVNTMMKERIQQKFMYRGTIRKITPTLAVQVTLDSVQHSLTTFVEHNKVQCFKSVVLFVKIDIRIN